MLFGGEGGVDGERGKRVGGWGGGVNVSRSRWPHSVPPWRKRPGEQGAETWIDTPTHLHVKHKALQRQAQVRRARAQDELPRRVAPRASAAALTRHLVVALEPLFRQSSHQAVRQGLVTLHLQRQLVVVRRAARRFAAQAAGGAGGGVRHFSAEEPRHGRAHRVRGGARHDALELCEQQLEELLPILLHGAVDLQSARKLGRVGCRPGTILER